MTRLARAVLPAAPLKAPAARGGAAQSQFSRRAQFHRAAIERTRAAQVWVVPASEGLPGCAAQIHRAAARDKPRSAARSPLDRAARADAGSTAPIPAHPAAKGI